MFSIFTFDFGQGEGCDPGAIALDLMATGSIDFFRSAFLHDNAFKDAFVGLSLEDIAGSYIASEEKWKVKVLAKIEVDEDAISPSIGSIPAANVMAKANLNRYLNQYVRRNKLGIRTKLFDIEKVHVKAATRGF